MSDENQLSIEEPEDSNIHEKQRLSDSEQGDSIDLKSMTSTGVENSNSVSYVIEDENDRKEMEKKDDKMDAIEKRKETTFFETLMNCLNSLLGAGILSVPNSFISVGLVPSVIFICCMAFLSYIASIINVKLHLKYDTKGFDEIVEKLMGRWGSVSYSIVTIIFLWASMVAYVIIAGDTITSWFAFGGIDISQFKYRAVMVLVYSLIIPIALTIPKNFRFIGVFSTFSIGFIFFYVIAAVVKVCQILPKYGVAPTLKIARFDIQIFSALGVYALTFALPCVLIPILTPYAKNYRKRRDVVISSFVICAFLTIFPSILMYLVLGDDADGNVLNSFPSNDILFTVVRVGFFLIVSFSFPLIAKSCMCDWSHLMFKINNANDLTGCKFWSTLILTVSVPVLLGMFLPQCKPAIAVGGALGGCLGCYTYPSILNILASERKWTAENVLCGLFAIFGIAIAAISTYTSALDAVEAFRTDFV